MSIKEKEFDNWNHRNDYANGDELMVTITLAEYRELIFAKSTASDNLSKVRSELSDTKNKLAAANDKLLNMFNGGASYEEGGNQ